MTLTKKQLQMSISIIAGLLAVILICIFIFGKSEPILPETNKITKSSAPKELSPVARQMYQETEKLNDKQLSVYCKK